MKLRKICIQVFIFITLTSSAQLSDNNYFNKELLGDSPIVFGPDSISLNNRKEIKITFSPDGKECFIGVVLNNIFTLLHSVVTDNQWTVPVSIDFPNTTYEREPMISPTNDMLFFAAPQSSTVEHWITDIWVSHRTDSIWSTPEKLPSPVNSDSEEWHPTITSDGTLYFCSNRSGKYYVYKSEKIEGQYYSVEKLSNKINAPQIGSSDPFIAPDESYLIFTSGEEDPDQFISYKKEDGSWTSPKNLGSKINSDGIEYGSFISYDSKYYFFSRVESYGLTGFGDLYWVNTSFIDSLRDTNFQPQVLNLIPNQMDTVGNLFLYTVPDSIFFDEDGNETLTFSATLNIDEDIPGWLDFDPNTTTFEGNPTLAGDFNIKVTATDNAGLNISDEFRLRIVEPTVSITQNIINAVKVYPNPVNDTLNVYSEEIWQNIYYEIFNLSGKRIDDGKLNNTIIDISRLNKGMYILRLNIDEFIFNKKFVIE